MTTQLLAFEANAFQSVAAMFFALTWLMLWTRNRGHAYMLLLCAGSLLYVVYFGVLAITAGPQPALPRAIMAVPVRVLGMAAAAVLVWGKSTMLLALWRNGSKARRENST